MKCVLSETAFVMLLFVAQLRACSIDYVKCSLDNRNNTILGTMKIFHPYFKILLHMRKYHIYVSIVYKCIDIFSFYIYLPQCH